MNCLVENVLSLEERAVGNLRIISLRQQGAKKINFTACKSVIKSLQCN